MASINYIGFDNYSRRYCIQVSFSDKNSSQAFLAEFIRLYQHCGGERNGKYSNLIAEPNISKIHTINVTFLLTDANGNFEASASEHNDLAKIIIDRYIGETLKSLNLI